MVSSAHISDVMLIYHCLDDIFSSSSNIKYKFIYINIYIYIYIYKRMPKYKIDILGLIEIHFNPLTFLPFN